MRRRLSSKHKKQRAAVRMLKENLLIANLGYRHHKITNLIQVHTTKNPTFFNHMKREEGEEKENCGWLWGGDDMERERERDKRASTTAKRSSDPNAE